VSHPDEDDEEHDDGRGEDGEDSGKKACQECVVFPCMDVRLAKVARHEGVIAPVRLPGDIEDVAEDGDGADDDFDADVDHHPDEGDVRDAANPGSEDDDEGGDAGEDVAEAGDEADETVEPDADGREGDAEPIVEEVREDIDVLVGEPMLGTLADGEGSGRGAVFGWKDFGWQDFGISRFWHSVLRRSRARMGCGANATIRAGMAAIVQRQNA
jgi:hypothetical protein